MSPSSLAYPRKKFNERAGIRIRAWWRKYVHSAQKWVDSPPAFIVTSYVSSAFASLFAWQIFTATSHFWANVNNLLFTGWMALLLGTFTLSQVKVVNRAIGLPVVGIFLIAASTYLHSDAKNLTIQILNRHFPFSVLQLSAAIDYGTEVVFAIEIAVFAMLSLTIWYCLSMAPSFMSARHKQHIQPRHFFAASAGAIVSTYLVGSLSYAASGSFGIDVLLVRAAYEMDFTSSFTCDSVAHGSRVLLSKMSDNVGYAAKLSFPDRPLFRMKEKDQDLKQSMPLSSGTYRVVTCNKPVS